MAEPLSKTVVKDMLGRSGVLPLHDAEELLRHQLQTCPRVGSKIVNLMDGLGRVLARNCVAQEDIPPAPRSIMDGYALRAQDTYGASETLPVYLKISGEVFMGHPPEGSPNNECCYKIPTGGLLPEQTDAVIMFENTVFLEPDMLEVLKPVAPGDNVIQRGDDVRTGEVICSKGQVLKPADIGLLAGLGFTEITVHRRVRAGIFSTGDEIVPHAETPPPGKIRDMNSLHLGALAAMSGAKTTYYGIAPDEESSFRQLAEKALMENDVVLFSGSSSVGTRDLGEKIISKLGTPGILFHGVAVKPGKPVIASRAGDKFVFGLPGHPVSAAVAYELFVDPTIAALSGKTPLPLPQHRTVQAKCMRNLNSSGGRTDFIRVTLLLDEHGQYEAHPVLGKSGALSTLSKAEGYFILAASSQGIEKGERVTVRLY